MCKRQGSHPKRYIRSVFPYPGGKSKALDILEKYIPPGTTKLASPFFGGGSFERFCAKKYGMHVSGGDSFEPLVNFWRVLKRDAEGLALECARLVPHTKQQHESLLHNMNMYENTHGKNPRNDTMRAACFYNSIRTSYSGVPYGTYMPGNVRTLERSIPRLPLVVMRNVRVNTADFRAFILAHKNWWMYVDPPYHQAVRLYRRNASAYLDQMAFDHEELRNVLREHPSWMLSYNDDPYIRELYKGHRIVSIRFAHSLRKDATNEILIFSKI